MRCGKRGWLVAALIAGYYCWLQTMGPGTFSLGTANSYTILSKAGIPTTVLLPSSITGDGGVSPIAATTITGCSLTDQPLFGSALHGSCAGSLHHPLVQQLLGSALHESGAGSSHDRLVQPVLGSGLRESCAGSSHHHLGQQLRRSIHMGPVQAHRIPIGPAAPGQGSA